MKKKILVFSYAYAPLVGGAEIAVQELTARLGSDFDFEIITRRFSRTHKRRETIGAAAVHRVGGGKFLFSFASALRALSLHRRKRFDAVWAVMANRAGAAALIFKLLHPSMPLVLTLQEGDPIPVIRRQMGVFRPLFKILFRSARIVTAISTYLAGWGKAMGAKNIKIIPNGVDAEKFKIQNPKVKSEEKVIVTTSRLVEKNGVGDLIDAMRYLPLQYKLGIVGSGPLGELLKSKVKNLKLEDRVLFAGEVAHTELPAYLHRADIFCRPSLSEGMGISFVEAMAAGLPVIATPVGGIVDFLKDKETGLFCKVGDPKSIADAVLLLENQPAIREAIISSALRMVQERYDWNIIAREMREVFNEIIMESNAANLLFISKEEQMDIERRYKAPYRHS